MRVDEPLERRRDRRQAAAGVDEDRDASLGRQREDGREPLVVEQELLGARMELDPAGARGRGSGAPPRSAPRRARGARTGRAGLPSGPRTRASGRCRRGSRGAGRARRGRRRRPARCRSWSMDADAAPRSVRPCRRCPCRGACGRRRSRGRPGGRRAAARPTSAATCRARSSASIVLNLAPIVAASRADVCRIRADCAKDTVGATHAGR